MHREYHFCFYRIIFVIIAIFSKLYDNIFIENTFFRNFIVYFLGGYEMNYEPVLLFVKQLLGYSHLSITLYKEPFAENTTLDLGLRHLLNPDTDYQALLQSLSRIISSNKLYKIHDKFHCHYIIFLLPGTDVPTYASVGPYRLKTVTHQDIQEIAISIDASSNVMEQLNKFYEDLPLVQDESQVLGLLYTLGETLWGSLDNFSLEEITDLAPYDSGPLEKYDNFTASDEAFVNMKLLEERYSIENQLMNAVSQGQTHKAEMLIRNFLSRQMERRSSDLLRDAKNYSVILNTLLRKAAEMGTVHPLHIDRLSSRFSRRIEACNAVSELVPLHLEMVHKYCLLVKNHSLKGYSFPVRRVLTQIDSDLTADLSLRTLAEYLNVNPSYLSALFKRETGSTLTEYVNKKRIEHAIFLLNTSSAQIQTIAQQCGISDVNYFTKIFKKQIGKTPKAYRDGISPYQP